MFRWLAYPTLKRRYFDCLMSGKTSVAVVALSTTVPGKPRFFVFNHIILSPIYDHQYKIYKEIKHDSLSFIFDFCSKMLLQQLFHKPQKQPMLSKSTTPPIQTNTSFSPFDCCFRDTTQDEYPQFLGDQGFPKMVSQSQINQNQKNLRKSSEGRRVSLKTTKFCTNQQIPSSNRHSFEYLPKYNIFTSESRVGPLPSMKKPMKPLRVSFDHTIISGVDQIRQSNKSQFLPKASKAKCLKIIEQPQVKILPQTINESLTNSVVKVNMDDKMFKSSCEINQKMKQQGSYGYIRKRTMTEEYKNLELDKPREMDTLSEHKSRLDELNCKKTESVKDEDSQLHVSQTINLRKNTSSCMEFELLEGLARRTPPSPYS